MISIEVKPLIQINLENGIYLFDNKSGIGKTYLFKLLNVISSRTDFLCLTLSNYFLVNDLVNVCKSRNVKVIILDRYDLYINQFSEELLQLKDNVIILVDCKHPDKLSFDSGNCGINFTEDKLEVFDYDSI